MSDLIQMAEDAAAYFLGLQGRICAALETFERRVDGARFREDQWEHATGGGGRTRVLVDGAVFEKGGAHFSMVRGGI